MTDTPSGCSKEARNTTNTTQPRRNNIQHSPTMCITHIYVDRYPDGREVEFRHLSNCQYGTKERPCRGHTIVDSPVRRIQYGDAPPHTQAVPNHSIYVSSPPLSSSSSQNRYSGEFRRHSRSQSRSDDGRLYVKQSSLRPARPHCKERIIVVDAPPTPTTPPKLFGTFTAPSSPNPRGRPIIVDERPLRRAPSHRRSHSRPPFGWDTPSTSHTSFDLRAEREREERLQREQEHTQRRRREDREAQLDEEARRARLIAEANEDIKRRAAVPVPMPPRQRTYLRPVVDQTQALQERLGGLTLDTRGENPPMDRAAMDEAMKQRLRERQMPKRRSTVGPGHRRQRVEYDDGMYRWE